MTTSTANLKPLPEPQLQRQLHRVYDSHDEYRGTDARYLDGVHRREPRRSPLLGYLGLAVEVALIGACVVGAGCVLVSTIRWVLGR